MIRLTIEFLLGACSSGRRTISCLPASRHMGEVFRTDAKAEHDFAVLGGWECRAGQRPEASRWFSLRIDRAQAPEFFARGTAQQSVAAFELLATLFGIYLFVDKDALRTGTFSLTGITDNQGNSFVTAKLHSTRFPLNVVLMQLTTLLEERGLWLDLRWRRRDDNIEADALTNEDFSSFDPSRRCACSWDLAVFPVLQKFLARGCALYAQLDVLRAERKQLSANFAQAPRVRYLPVARGNRGKKRRVTLREADPW